MYLASLPLPGQTLGDGRLETNMGGKGANQAIASHRAGANTCFISCVGNDNTGAQILHELMAMGLDTSPMKTVENTATGTACIFVDASGENCIGLTPGANAALSPELVEEYSREITNAAVVLMQLEIPIASVLAAAKHAASGNACLILNPAPAKPLGSEIYGYIDLITPNRGELAVLTGMQVATEEDLLSACRVLLQKGVAMVLVTLGREGAVLVDRDGHQYFSAYSVVAADTTAAGDCFNGYLAAAIAESGMANSGTAIRRAMAAAAISVTRKGAIPSIPSKTEVDAFLRR